MRGMGKVINRLHRGLKMGSFDNAAPLTPITECLQCPTHQQVFWFYVSVDNIETVQVLDGTCQIEQHTAGVSLCVLIGGGDCIKEIAPLEKIQIFEM